MSDLALVVIYTPQLEEIRSFYEKLGLSFQKEKHGRGPEHYSTQLGSTILEIYPTKKDPSRNRLGFTVDNLDSILEVIPEHVVRDQPQHI